MNIRMSELTTYPPIAPTRSPSLGVSFFLIQVFSESARYYRCLDCSTKLHIKINLKKIYIDI